MKKELCQKYLTKEISYIRPISGIRNFNLSAEEGNIFVILSRLHTELSNLKYNDEYDEVSDLIFQGEYNNNFNVINHFVNIEKEVLPFSIDEYVKLNPQVLSFDNGKVVINLPEDVMDNLNYIEYMEGYNIPNHIDIDYLGGERNYLNRSAYYYIKNIDDLNNVNNKLDRYDEQFKIKDNLGMYFYNKLLLITKIEELSIYNDKINCFLDIYKNNKKEMNFFEKDSFDRCIYTEIIDLLRNETIKNIIRKNLSKNSLFKVNDDPDNKALLNFFVNASLLISILKEHNTPEAQQLKSFSHINANMSTNLETLYSINKKMSSILEPYIEKELLNFKNYNPNVLQENKNTFKI